MIKQAVIFVGVGVRVAAAQAEKSCLEDPKKTNENYDLTDEKPSKVHVRS